MAVVMAVMFWFRGDCEKAVPAGGTMMTVLVMMEFTMGAWMSMMILKKRCPR